MVIVSLVPGWIRPSSRIFTRPWQVLMAMVFKSRRPFWIQIAWNKNCWIVVRPKAWSVFRDIFVLLVYLVLTFKRFRWWWCIGWAGLGKLNGGPCLLLHVHKWCHIWSVAKIVLNQPHAEISALWIILSHGRLSELLDRHLGTWERATILAFWPFALLESCIPVFRFGRLVFVCSVYAQIMAAIYSRTQLIGWVS